MKTLALQCGLVVLSLVYSTSAYSIVVDKRYGLSLKVFNLGTKTTTLMENGIQRKLYE